MANKELKLLVIKTICLIIGAIIAVGVFIEGEGNIGGILLFCTITIMMGLFTISDYLKLILMEIKNVNA